MAEWITALERFEGIIGALLGVVFGAFVTRWSRTFGKTSVLVSKWEVQWFVNDDWGGFRPATPSEATRAHLSATLVFYNSRDVPSGLTDFRWCLRRGNREVFQTGVKDRSTRRMSGPVMIVDDLEVLNVPPHQFVPVEVEGTVDEEGMEHLRMADTLWVVARTHEGKKLEVKVCDLAAVLRSQSN